MENIYNNYRTVVERARSAGIITDEIKEFYLSAIDEENDSDLSELENILSTPQFVNRKSFLKMENDDLNSLIKYNSNENTDNKVKEMPKSNHKKYVNDCQFLPSEDSIENYSALDIKNPKYKEVDTQATSSDISTDKEKKSDSKAIEKDTTTLLSRVLKKPIRNQRIDFGIPIYTDVERKTVKSHGFVLQSSPENYESMCCCKIKNQKHQECVQAENLKTEIPAIDFSRTKTEKNVSSTNSKDCIDPSTSTNQISYPHTGANNSLKHNKSAEYPSGQTEKLNKHCVNRERTLKNETEVLNMNQCFCLHPKNVMNSGRTMKVPKRIITEEGKYKIKLKKPARHGSHQTSVDSRIPTKVYLDVQKVKNKNKLCDACAMKTVKHTSDNISFSEDDTTSEDKISLSDILSKRNRLGDRLLNVNIICQFYPEEEKVDIADNNQDTNNSTPELANQESETKDETLEITDAPKTATESWKGKQSKKMHRLSRIFTEMKISRKPKDDKKKMNK